MEFVDIAAARTIRGPVLVTASVVPSPWSEAAKGLFHVKGLPVVGVRARVGDAERVAWTGIQNVPVVLYEDEPPRSGWAEIITFCERLGGSVSLVPGDAAERARLFGLIHEVAGEDGLGWCSRLLMIHGGFISEGARGFPLPAARYLAQKYGYAAERIPGARARIAAVLDLLADTLSKSHAAGHAYLLGAHLSALDVYAATFLTSVLFDPEVDCLTMRPDLRPAFAYLKEEVAATIPPALVEHRALMFTKHLVSPIVL